MPRRWVGGRRAVVRGGRAGCRFSKTLTNGRGETARDSAGVFRFPKNARARQRRARQTPSRAPCSTCLRARSTRRSTAREVPRTITRTSAGRPTISPRPCPQPAAPRSTRRPSDRASTRVNARAWRRRATTITRTGFPTRPRPSPARRCPRTGAPCSRSHAAPVTCPRPPPSPCGSTTSRTPTGPITSPSRSRSDASAPRTGGAPPPENAPPPTPSSSPRPVGSAARIRTRGATGCT